MAEIVLMFTALHLAITLLLAGKYLGLKREIARLQAAGTRQQSAPIVLPNRLENVALEGAGRALAKPPSDYQITLKAIQGKGRGQYRIPLGWYISTDQPDLATAQLVGDVNHILITGQSNAGKDNLALSMMLALANQYKPDQCQIAILDGKGLDWLQWRDKQHTWMLADEPEKISAAMAKLTAERKRRRNILADAGVKKWENYAGHELPLLIVYVSELLQLQSATSKSELTTWLETELTAARAFGIRYILATQTATNFSTQWRSQISLYLAGYQPSQHQDEPNTTLRAADIEQLGAIPPSALPAPTGQTAGVFLAMQGATAINVRCSYIDDTQAGQLLDTLPNKPLHSAPTKGHDTQPDPILNSLLQAATETSQAVASRSNSVASRSNSVAGATPLSERLEASATLFATEQPETHYLRQKGTDQETVAVTEDEKKRIIAVAQVVKTRRALCKEIFGVEGGQNYKKVAAVCDDLGLLQPAVAGR